MGKKKITEQEALSRKLSSDKKKILKKKKYLAEWDGMFEKMKAYKKEFGKTTISKDYPDQKLYRWYRKQKVIYNHPTQKLPKEHLEKLQSINFYFGDGHKEIESKSDQAWINLLKEALESGEKVYTNHRYKYKGKGLGTFLVGIKQAYKKGKKIETYKKIESLGFELEAHSRNLMATSMRFLRDLETRKDVQKIGFQNRFNHNILRIKEQIPQEIKAEIDRAWEKRFHEKRAWHKISKFKSADDFINGMVSDMMNTENPNYKYFFSRFKHSILKRREMFNNEHRATLSNAWEYCFSEKLDWSIKVNHMDAESIAERFIEQIEDKNLNYEKHYLKSRFSDTIYPKRDVLPKKLVNRINKAWKKRFSDTLDWDRKSSKPNPKTVADNFIDELIIGKKEDIAKYKAKLQEIIPYRKHWTKDIIKKIETLWEWRFGERIIWYPNKDTTKKNMDKGKSKVELWKQFRYDETNNPKGKWITGPKAMGKIYAWVNRIKKNKYALARVLVEFSKEEAKEMKRQGFHVDFKLIEKAKELGI